MQIKQTITGSEPLTLAEVKAYCSIDHDSDDTYLTALITRVREIAEKSTDKSFIDKTIIAFWSDYEQVMTLPYPPHTAITEVKINDVDVTSDTFKTGLTEFIITLPYVYTVGNSIENEGLKVTYTVTADVPGGVKEAMLKLIKDLYDNRGEQTDYNSNNLINNFETIISIYRM